MEIRPILSALLRQKTGPLLVAVQVAISLAILANALFIVSQRIATADRPSGVADEANVGYLAVRPLEKRPHAEVLARQQEVVQALRALPGVESAAWTSQMPMSRSGSSGSVRASLAQTQETANVALYFAHEGFVKTLGLKLVEGRDFQPDEIIDNDPDTAASAEDIPRNTIVSLALARLLFPDSASFVGKTFYFGMGQARPSRIVGVVERLQGPQAHTGPSAEYSAILPLRMSLPMSRYVVRTAPGQRDAVMLRAQEVVRKLHPMALKEQVRSVSDDRYTRYRNERAMAWMLIAVSVLLLLVTVSGIVGMTALRVAQRRKQIGVRRALGARWRDIVRYFVTENLLITSAGIAAGLLLALALNGLLRRTLEMGQLPVAYLAAGAGVLWLLGVAAVWGPASRAASTPPAIATRTA
ncbi:ABC transporter permease [Ramlibacter sp. XY19]|uniref:FtsX-like permease family protein n=1 Tax=Ramlibacter paludis TaxID=2908000 RepID=UPI0023DC654C|nr:FtsX-like permease family protein [Ramlibacter paludis]MCG2595663.1 ABC transporter permease [Ramlibacter paludis]